MNNIDQKKWLANLQAIDSESSFLLLDLSIVAKKYQSLKESLPDFSVFYAVKCNPEQEIINKLHKIGSKFEIASIGELNRLVKVGINPVDVIYSNPVKPASHIRQSFEMGLYRFAFDSPEELKKISENAPGASVYLRMSVSNHGSLISLSNKFGANKSKAVDLLLQAQGLGLKPIGIAFHVGSQADDLGLWDQAFEDVNDVMKRLLDEGVKLSVLNIGGGFPAQYTEKVPTIEEIGEKIQKNIPKLPYELELWCEPGRYLVGEAGVIAATVIGKATRNNKPWLYLDVGRFQAFVEMFESDELKYPVFTSREDSGAKHRLPYTLTGPSCDSYDTIMRDIELPVDIQEGDRVYFATAGAYTNVYGSAFNDFPVPEVICL